MRVISTVFSPPNSRIKHSNPIRNLFQIEHALDLQADSFDRMQGMFFFPNISFITSVTITTYCRFKDKNRLYDYKRIIFQRKKEEERNVLNRLRMSIHREKDEREKKNRNKNQH